MPSSRACSASTTASSRVSAVPSASSRRRRDAAVARSSAWPCRRRSTSAWRSARTRRRSAMPATRTSSSWRRPAASARRSSSAFHASRASWSSGSDPASCACSAVTSESRCSRGGDRRPCLLELAGHPALLLGGALALDRDPPHTPRRGGRPPAPPPARASRARASAMRALGQPRPRQLGRCGRLLRPAPRLLDGGRRHHAGPRAHPPARGREAVALGGDHHQVVAERARGRSPPPSRRRARPGRPACRGPTRRRHRRGAPGRGRAPARRSCPAARVRRRRRTRRRTGGAPAPRR